MPDTPSQDGRSSSEASGSSSDAAEPVPPAGDRTDEEGSGASGPSSGGEPPDSGPAEAGEPAGDEQQAEAGEPAITVRPLNGPRTIALPSSADMTRWSGRSVTRTDVQPALPGDSAVTTGGPLRSATPVRPGDDGTTGGRPGRGWAFPLLVTTTVVVLLGVLTVGVWLIVNALSAGDGAPPPLASTSPVSPSATATPSSPQQSLTPSSTAAPTSDAPALVTVPQVRGATEAAATQTLLGLGLRVAVQHREDPDVAAGTVVGVEPAEGTAVAPGSVVTLIVARPPASPSPSGSPVSPPASSVRSPAG